MDQLLRVEDVSRLTGVPVGTLRYWRSLSATEGHPGIGPRSTNLGGRRVVYRQADVEAWLEAQFAKAVGE